MHHCFLYSSLYTMGYWYYIFYLLLLNFQLIFQISIFLFHKHLIWMFLLVLYVQVLFLDLLPLSQQHNVHSQLPFLLVHQIFPFHFWSIFLYLNIQPLLFYFPLFALLFLYFRIIPLFDENLYYLFVPINLLFVFPVIYLIILLYVLDCMFLVIVLFLRFYPLVISFLYYFA